MPTADRSDIVLEVTACIAAFAAVFVALRLFTKGYLNNTIGIDDWIIGFDLVRTMEVELFGHH